MTTATALQTVCGDCGEPSTFDRRKRTWLHDRTGSNVCAPLCSTEGCGKPGVRKLGYHGFDGASARFIRTGWACVEHTPRGAMEWA